MRKIRRVYMTLALAVLLAGMTACGNNTTNDTGNGNTNTESDCNRYLTPRAQEMHQIISGHLRSASGRIRKIREF